MKERKVLIYAYECDSCRHHYEVEMTFREDEPADRDRQGRVQRAGYPEQQPECPTCHSQEVVRVDVREKD